ncbi:MAG: uracil-DNA glycosylase family protein, partial [Elusimicrobiales bacterium]|nr:uracil-DNA glycosylase family protein [Elusimicrobiales bacterium]
AMTGWRIGWVVASAELGQVYENLIQYNTSGVPTFLQYGAVAAMDQGEPFVGRSGQLLDKILDTVLGLKRSEVYIANIVKCHPMVNPDNPESHGNDRPPSPEEIAVCRPYLERQIALIKPACIVTLGSVATKVLLGIEEGISKVRGKWYVYPKTLFGGDADIKLLPTYHPAALLRNPRLKLDTWEDMKLLKAFLEGKTS